MRYILDIEATNLLGPSLDYSVMPYRLVPEFKVHCVVIRNIDSNAVKTLVQSEITKANMQKALKGCTELIGHNIVGYDLPTLMLYGVLDYHIGYPGEPSVLFGNPCVITDTLLWSKLLNADRLGGHGLAAWGKRLGNYKGDFHEWDKYSEEMLDYCITPEQKLLGEDLHWKPASSFSVGDNVLGFTEHGANRKFETATIEKISYEDRPVYEVSLSSGTKVYTTEEHRWLVAKANHGGSSYGWVETKNLRYTGKFASKVPKLLDVWEEDKSKDAGWLAGMFDGEGTLAKARFSISVAQRPTKTLEKLENLLSSKYGNVSKRDVKADSDCVSLRLNGSAADKIKFLGQIRPERLIEKFSFEKMGRLESRNSLDTVTAVTPVGTKTIIKIQTSTRTFVCEGYPMHNCIQDTNVNLNIYEALIKEQGKNNWYRAYSMEVKLADLTLRQELFGFELDRELAEKNLADLTEKMQEIAKKVDPLLPPKKLGKAELGLYTPPAKQLKKDGELTIHMINFINRHGLDYVDWLKEINYKGKVLSIPLTEPLETEKVATIEDIDTVKSYLMGLGWVPSEVKERDLVKNTDKTKKTFQEVVDTVDRYVEQTKHSLFRELRLELLDCKMEELRDMLVMKIEGTKPIYVPTTPKLTVGLEKEICPNLVSLGEKAEFVKDVVHYYTYRHRKNSIAGGALDEDGEPETGFLSALREDGRVPTPADTLGANTGRYRHKVICNIPRVTSLYGEQMRNMFRAGKGFWQVGYDFASLEARVMGHYVLPYEDGENLAEALVAEKPLDIHTINGKKLGISRSDAKSFSYACLPMNTKVLTTKGWKLYEDIEIGEPILTFNTKTNQVETDTVLHKVLVEDKPVIEYKNKRDSFQCTEDHRWYGYRRSKSRKGSKAVWGFFEAEQFTTEHNILLTGEYVGGKSSVTPKEAELMGYILSDGSITWSNKSNRTSCSKGIKKGVRIALCQSKNKFHKEIQELLHALNLRYTKTREEKENGNTVYQWVLSSPDARNFLDRVVGSRKQKHDTNWTEWVIGLSRESLEAFYTGFYNGDGDLNSSGETITQNVGNIHEAIVTTMQLLGRGRVSLNKHSGTNKICEGIRLQKRKTLSLQKQEKINKGIQDTFCLTTKNSTFIIWQGDFIGITGNCIYGAQPKKLAKMLNVSESEAKRLFNDYWDAVPALKQLKERVERAWEASGKKTILGLDGRLLNTRSKHSLINVLFQSGGAICAKWSAVRLAQAMEREGILGDPFVNSKEERKVWWIIHVHDEQQMAIHPSLLSVKSFATEDEAKESATELSSAVGHGSKGYYIGLKTKPIECIAEGIKTATEELKLRVDLGFEWIPGLSWGQCH